MGVMEYSIGQDKLTLLKSLRITVFETKSRHIPTKEIYSRNSSYRLFFMTLSIESEGFDSSDL